MDRGHGHRAVLTTAVAAIGGAALLACMGGLNAQTPTPEAAVPAATATPWVQASPPVPAPTAKPAPPPEKAPSPSAAPTASPSKEEIARAMARKREEELARQAAAASPTVKPSPPRPLPPRLSPEENEAYERNLSLWSALPPDEKKEIRGLATARMQEETEKAYESSGLNLNEDQREVFTLRYRQERRRLERELQEKARAERERRLPEIMERLKREFAGGSTPKPKATPALSPTPAPTPLPK